MSGVLFDKRVPPHVKGNIHNTIVQPAMLYGMETVPVTSSHVKKLEVTEMKMCRWVCGHTLSYHVRNDDITKKLKVENITERCRKARLRWFSHVKRRDQEYVGRKTLEMVPPGRRKRGRPKQRWMDCVNRDMRAIGTTKDEVHDRTGWRRIVSAAVTHSQVGAARRRRITGTKAIPDDNAMGVDVDSMNMSDHVEFDAPQTSDLAETMARRMLEGIPCIDLMLDTP